LDIPAEKQKNDTEESIPLLPGLESLLLETPEADRYGWVFNPQSIERRPGWASRSERLSEDYVGKMLTRIGTRAGIVVQPAKGETPAKYASAHDLRRSCAERLLDAGVPMPEVRRIMRHASEETTRRYYAPGTVQKSAQVIRKVLGAGHTLPKKRTHSDSQST
jgi:integrase